MFAKYKKMMWYLNRSFILGCRHNQMSKKRCQMTEKKVKIGEISMFYHLKPWQSWQVVPFSFIWMLRKSNKKFI
jgi:hypothetical protein